MAVLQRKELEDSPLADLHAIASELGLERYRALRKAELVGAILGAQGGEDAAPAEEAEPDEVPADEALEPDAAEDAPAAEEDEPEPAEEPEDEDEDEDEEPESPDEEERAREEELVSGVLDILSNGSGFVRVDPSGQSRDDVYVSPAQIRRCELRAGDEVGGPVRPLRRNERHPSLVRVDTVNGAPAEPPEERPRFADLTPVYPTERLAALEDVPIGKGSRVAVGGPPGAGATRLLREIVAALAGREPNLEVAVALVGIRPEEVGEWREAAPGPVYGGAFDRSTEAQAQAAELAIERAKRAVERGRDAVIVVDSLEALPSGSARRVFGAARKAEEGGSLTVIAATGMAWEPLRWATTRLMLDPPGPEEAPKVSKTRSGAQRPDLLA